MCVCVPTTTVRARAPCAIRLSHVNSVVHPDGEVVVHLYFCTDTCVKRSMACAICCDDIDGDDVCLPGCNHRFHTACILTAAQYDSKCPVCRQLPVGVQLRAHSTIERVVSIVYLDVNRVEEDGGAQEARTAWRRYRVRRRRFLNKNHTVLDAFNRLTDVRKDVILTAEDAEREYKQGCREVWRTNPVVRRHMAKLTRLRRQERRLQKQVHDALLDGIGPEPTFDSVE